MSEHFNRWNTAGKNHGVKRNPWLMVRIKIREVIWSVSGNGKR